MLDFTTNADQCYTDDASWEAVSVPAMAVNLTKGLCRICISGRAYILSNLSLFHSYVISFGRLLTLGIAALKAPDAPFLMHDSSIALWTPAAESNSRNIVSA